MSGFEQLASIATFRPISNWPGTRTKDPQRCPFGAPWRQTVELLVRELKMLDAKQTIVEIDLREQDLRLDGLPRANARMQSDGVVLSLQSKHGPLRYACDRFKGGSRGYGTARLDGWQANTRAIALGLEALRKVDRYGITERGEQYRGFLALEMGDGRATGMTLDDAYAWIAEHTEMDAAAVRSLTEWSTEDGTWERVKKKVRALTHPDRHGQARKAWDRTEAAIELIERGR